MTRHRLAIYDLDKTITRAPTYTPFLVHAALNHAPWRLVLLPLAGLAGLGFKLGLRTRGQVKEAAHRLMLGERLPAREAETLARTFADRVIAHGVHPQAIRRIEADRAAGFRIVIATASYAFYARAIAEKLGIEDVIGTRTARYVDASILPRIEGENCYGPAKLAMIRDWLAHQGIAREDAFIRFYSDHASDAPCLDFADEPFAVNAHAALAKLARVRGWPMLDWRD